MRFAIIVASAATLLVGSAAAVTAAPAPTGDATYAIAAVTPPVTASLAVTQQPPAKGEVDVKIDVDDGGAWYGNPFWIVIGVVALLVVVLLVALAGRGGGDTTVVR